MKARYYIPTKRVIRSTRGAAAWIEWLNRSILRADLLTLRVSPLAYLVNALTGPFSLLILRAAPLTQAVSPRVFRVKAWIERLNRSIVPAPVLTQPASHSAGGVFPRNGRAPPPEYGIGNFCKN